jgi:hypothetical protein
VALEPKPRPRAFRIGATSETNGEKPAGPLVIETLADPYEAEAKALMATQEAGEAAVETAQGFG